MSGCRFAGNHNGHVSIQRKNIPKDIDFNSFAGLAWRDGFKVFLIGNAALKKIRVIALVYRNHCIIIGAPILHVGIDEGMPESGIAAHIVANAEPFEGYGVRPNQASCEIELCDRLPQNGIHEGIGNRFNRIEEGVG